jgi:antitoxin HicB
MPMRYIYPITIERDEAGFFLATFKDVPEAGTDAVTRDEAVAGAHDVLIAVLAGYVDGRRDIPPPSQPADDQPVVYLPPLVSAKLALYQAMPEAGTNNTQLADRLGISETAVRRLLDLDHRSHIGQVENALAVLGKRIIVDVRAAA